MLGNVFTPGPGAYNLRGNTDKGGPAFTIMSRKTQTDKEGD